MRFTVSLKLSSLAWVALAISISHQLLPAQQIAASQIQTTSREKTNARITLRAGNMTLEHAIAEIAKQAGMGVLRRADGLPVNVRVSVNLKEAPVVQALATVTRGTGLSAEIASDGETIILTSVKSSHANRAQGIVVGRITDAKSGKGISRANVSVDNGGNSVTSGEDGGYRLAGVVNGTHTVVVRIVGYAKQSRSVTVADGSTITVDFKLEPSANVLDQVVVTGTIAQTELKAVPNAITVITAKQIEERGITRIDQLFRGDIPGLFAQNIGSGALLDEVTMFSRGTTALPNSASAGVDPNIGITNPIKTYIDGVELADPKYLSQIDPKSIERIEILTGPQASTIYGSNAINGVMQIFTKRGNTTHPQLILNLLSGWIENNFSSARTPQHDYSAQINGVESRFSYNVGGSWNYMGPWTPAKQFARVSSFGGARLDLPTFGGAVTVDITLRHTQTRSVQRGTNDQALSGYSEIGWYSYISSTSGLSQPTTRTLTGQTLGLTLSYVPSHWWSHEFGLGTDISDTERLVTARGYQNSNDTTLLLSQSHTDRRSIRYSTTARIPVNSLIQLTVTAGTDNWQSIASSIDVSPQILTGSLTNLTGGSRRPGHNTGGFAQSQLGVNDNLFFTYGLRIEKNPTIGDKARVLPGRYGIAYTREIGSITAKLRGSYGRSIRPPASTLKDAVPQTTSVYITLYGNYDNRLSNPDLAPEHQQGGEGGLELYFGTSGSLVITRYNQTVVQLISLVNRADSVRSLAPCTVTPNSCDANSTFRDDAGYGFRYQSQYINLGSIRNQGWELQGTMSFGPLTTHGTYSWTKSRVIGVTPRYSALFASNAQYQPGATFRYLPEHTWALGVTYMHARSSVGLNVTGLGQMTNSFDDFYLRNLSGFTRLLLNQPNVSNTSRYISFNAPYALADLTALYRFSPLIEALLQVQNLGDKYTNDYSAAKASLGRQTKFGLRLRTK